MPTEEREFEPLMVGIQRVLTALDSQADAQVLEVAVEELRELYNDYGECCCRKAHVIKDPNQS